MYCRRFGSIRSIDSLDTQQHPSNCDNQSVSRLCAMLPGENQPGETPALVATRAGSLDGLLHKFLLAPHTRPKAGAHSIYIKQINQ